MGLFNDLRTKIEENVKSVINLAADHGETVLHLLKDNFTREVVEHIIDKKIVVSEKVILSELKKLEKEEPWTFQFVK